MTQAASCDINLVTDDATDGRALSACCKHRRISEGTSDYEPRKRVRSKQLKVRRAAETGH
ncbi:hypothetical protein PsorP6_010330 [Peronosclerospora sorghi]|uniref:Uncharacterized protein n=1 Tax=Peronosclerospora sorghi TaxID=230839 RepID=A0ACC0VVP0_9STRA|nr:hypothetical protein PsorP6_010330 [Peronosclerospora sorghi]